MLLSFCGVLASKSICTYIYIYIYCQKIDLGVVIGVRLK